MPIVSLGGKAGGLAGMGNRERRRRAAQPACFLAGFAIFLAAGCHDGHFPDSLLDSRPGEFVQDGTVVVRDGEEAQVRFKKLFDAPPKVEVVGFVQSWFKEEPYSKGS